MITTRLKCQNCSNEETFKIGTENIDDTLEDAKNNFKGKTKLHISSLQKKHTINSSQFGYEILTCTKCKTLKNQYTVTVEYDDIMVFKPYYKCQECGSTLEKLTRPIEDNLTDKCCTYCGNTDLTISD